MRFAGPILALFLLTGCAQVQSVIEWATQTQTTPQEANSVSAAANLYLALMPAASAMVKSPECLQPCKVRIANYSHTLRGYLDVALDAEAAGDSAKASLALKAFNQLYPAFTAAVGNK